MTQEPIRFAVIGINHGHIYAHVALLLEAGAEFVAYYAPEDDLAKTFSDNFPQAKRVATEDEILEDTSIQLVASASIASERAPLGARVMRHGKDFLADKPAITTRAQLDEVRQAQRETAQIFSIYYSVRFGNRAVQKAGDLVHAGAIGHVVQTLGLGPHRLGVNRPDWFYEKDKYGGILVDIGSHQADQFLYFTGTKTASVVRSHVRNIANPDHPGLEDFGETMLVGDKCTGYFRVDWLTPDGLPVYGDERLMILGTEGYIEIRLICDIAGRPGKPHLFLVDGKGTHYIPTEDVPLTFGSNLLNDIRNRTETAMTQEHAFMTAELSIQAEEQAIVLP